MPLYISWNSETSMTKCDPRRISLILWFTGALEIFNMYSSMKNMLHIKQISKVPACGIIRTYLCDWSYEQYEKLSEWVKLPKYNVIPSFLF